jgi:outer membrane protein assembly factor BamB
MGNRVFTTARSGRSQCFEIDRGDGQWTVHEVWNQKVQGYMSSPVSHGKTVFLHSNNERLTALGARSGDVLWTGRPMGKYQSLVGNDDVILALNSRGELLAVETNRDRTFRENEPTHRTNPDCFCLDESSTTHALAGGPKRRVLSRNALNEQSWSPPAIPQNALFLRTINHLCCINPGS